MTDSLAHVLLTRFNLPSGGAESHVRAKEDWLIERVKLFEQYCLPSVLAQTDQRFSWIIYLDPASPGWLQDRMARHCADGAFTPVYRPEVPRQELLEDVLTVVGHPATSLLTTNLDNDDGLALDFVARLRSAAAGRDDRVALFVRNGLILARDHTYLRADPANAFCSVLEPWDSSSVTCWSAWHIHLAQTMPSVVLDGPPGWLQVVHGRNVSNRVRGRLVSPTRYLPLFPGLLSGTRTPSGPELVVDTLVSGPTRGAQDCARRAGKTVVLRLAGPEGLTAVHARLRLVRSRLAGGKGPA